MQISSCSCNPASTQSSAGASPFAKAKQAFESLGTALDSGNITDAKAALEELQKNAPNGAARDKNNPMAEKMDALSKALDSGDVKAAQDAFADIKKAMAQRPHHPHHQAEASSGTSAAAIISSLDSDRGTIDATA